MIEKLQYWKKRNPLETKIKCLILIHLWMNSDSYESEVEFMSQCFPSHHIISPKDNHVSNLIINNMQYHLGNFHSGIQNILYSMRQQYWLIKTDTMRKRSRFPLCIYQNTQRLWSTSLIELLTWPSIYK